MAALAQPTKDDTFAALIDCFGRDLAALISEEAPHDPTPNEFIDLVVRVRNSLNPLSYDLDDAIVHLTDVLNSPEGDQPSLLAWARTHLRDAIDAAR
ncbi:hypothetical protein ACWGI9_41260 [Streptomyces sp. NPDC054833]